MFSEGFEKTAAKVPFRASAAERFAERAARIVGKAKEKARELGTTLKRSRQAIRRGVEKGTRLKQRAAGEQFAEKHIAKLRKARRREGKALLSGEAEQIRRGAGEKVKQRLKGIKDRPKGPSWAMRHPFLTAGGGLLAGKMIFGQKEPSAPPPTVVYPTEQYAGQGSVGPGYY